MLKIGVLETHVQIIVEKDVDFTFDEFIENFEFLPAAQREVSDLPGSLSVCSFCRIDFKFVDVAILALCNHIVCYDCFARFTKLMFDETVR